MADAPPVTTATRLCITVKHLLVVNDFAGPCPIALGYLANKCPHVMSARSQRTDARRRTDRRMHIGGKLFLAVFRQGPAEHRDVDTKSGLAGWRPRSAMTLA